MLWFSGINIFKKTSKWDPPACSWGEHLPDHQALPRSSAGAWFIQGSSAALVIFLLSLETSDLLQGCWESEAQENRYQGFLGDWVSFACCHWKYTTNSSFHRNWVLSCYRWDCHSSENCCQPVHLFLCEVVAWWGQMAGLGLKDYLLLLAPSPCPGNHVKWSSGFKSLQSLGFSSLSLRETEMIVFLRSLFCAHFPPSSASLWNSDAGMRLPSSS